MCNFVLFTELKLFLKRYSPSCFYRRGFLSLIFVITFTFGCKPVRPTFRCGFFVLLSPVSICMSNIDSPSMQKARFRSGLFYLSSPYVQYLLIHHSQICIMTVRAKYRCNSVTDNGYNKSANLTAVYSDKGENADFAKATPSGTLNIAIDNGVAASDFFKPTKEYYLTFEAVPTE